jgi:hypothetical protein
MHGKCTSPRGSLAASSNARRATLQEKLETSGKKRGITKRTRGGGSSRASAIAKASAEDISGESTCISVEWDGEAAIADALRGEGVPFLALPRNTRISKLAEPTAEGPVCDGGVAGLGAGDTDGGVVGR